MSLTTFLKDTVKGTAFPSENPAEPFCSRDDGKPGQGDVVNPGKHDVLLGRGGGTNNHVGNINFRKLVNEHKKTYLASSKVDKPKVAREVVKLWRKLDPPGRFLAKKACGKGGDETDVWEEVGDKKAREKASQCLRERTPDVLPFVQSLKDAELRMAEQYVPSLQNQMRSHKNPSGMFPGMIPQRPQQVASGLMNRGNAMGLPVSSSNQLPRGGQQQQSLNSAGITPSMMLSNPNFNLQALIGMQQQGMNFGMLNMPEHQMQQPSFQKPTSGVNNLNQMKGQDLLLQMSMAHRESIHDIHTTRTEKPSARVPEPLLTRSMQDSCIPPAFPEFDDKSLKSPFLDTVGDISMRSVRSIVPERNARTQGHLKLRGNKSQQQPKSAVANRANVDDADDIFASADDEVDELSLEDYRKTLEAYTQKKRKLQEEAQEPQPLELEIGEPEDLTLDEYKKSLEAYIANHQEVGHSDDFSVDDDIISDSDSLSPDTAWASPMVSNEQNKVKIDIETPIKRKRKKEQLGSFMSHQSTSSDVTHISGLSLLDDFSNDVSMGKGMDESNLSIMSELTDLSQQIDSLKMSDL